MSRVFLTIVLLFFVFLESSIESVPLTLAWLTSIAVVYHTRFTYILAVICGCIMDSLSFHPVGGRSIYFLFVTWVVFLYERKFNIQTIPFVFIVTTISTLFYTWIFGYHFIIALSLVNGIAATLFFFLHNIFRGDRK